MGARFISAAVRFVPAQGWRYTAVVFRHFIHRHPLAAYFLLAYVFSWAMCLPWLAFGTVAFPVVFFVGGMGPCVAALVVTHAQAGRAGVRALLAGVLRWRVGLKWWALSLLGFPLLMLTAALLCQWLTGKPVAWRLPGDPSAHLSLMMLVLSIPLLALLEEIGWRGYAWPALLQRHRLPMASAILGAFWACWHLPLFFIKGMSHEGMPFVPYLGMAMVVSLWLGWLYCRTRSLLLTTLFHATLNYSGLLPGSQSLPVVTTFGVLVCALAAVLLWSLRKEGAPPAADGTDRW